MVHYEWCSQGKSGFLAWPVPIRTLTLSAPQGPADAVIAPVASAAFAMFDLHAPKVYTVLGDAAI